MYHHILISTDGSDLATKGLDHGLTLARALNARVTILTVTEHYPSYIASGGEVWVAAEMSGEIRAARDQAAATILNAAAEAAAKMGVPAELVHIPDSAPAEAIIATAKERDCSLICMSSHGRRGLERLLLGSQTAEVLAHSPVPVLVVR